MKGTANTPPGIHQGAVDLIQAVKMHPDIMDTGPISADISAEQHCEYWKNAREATQSSLSGMHFGFYKATAKCKSLAQTVAGFVRIPFCTGYSPKRFRKSLHVSIMKEMNNYKPEKQRTIHLLEANFQKEQRSSLVGGCSTMQDNMTKFPKSSMLVREEKR